MKKGVIVGIIAGVTALAAGMVVLCVYMKQIRTSLNRFWDELEAKRSNLKIYMD